MTTYGSTAGVESLIPEIGSIDESTTPNTDQVTTWRAEAYSKINRAIGNAGYSTPVDTTAALYSELSGLENLYAAAYVKRARAIDTGSGMDESSSEPWLKEFYAQLKDLTMSNLTLVGVSLIASSTSSRRRRIRTLQMRKVDGYSRGSTDMWQISQGEYTGPSLPAE